MRWFVNPEREIVEHTCPQCGVRIGTNPLASLRQDRLAQSVVDALFPHFAAADAKAEAAFYAERGLTPPPPAARDGFSFADYYGGDDGVCAGNFEGDERPPSAAVASSSKPPTIAKLVRGQHYDDRVVFQLVPGSESALPPLRYPCIASSGRATVMHVLRLLSKELANAELPPERLELRFRGETLRHSNTLMHIFETLGVVGRAPIISYQPVAE